MPPKRMTANPIKPARYRAGKPTGADSSDSEAEGSASSETEEQTKARPARKIAPPPKVTSASGPGKIISRGEGGKINLSGAVLARDGEEERRRKAEAVREAENKAREEGFVTESEEGEEGSEEEGSEEEESSEEESESEEEAPRRVMMRPKFIPKSQRGEGGESKRREMEEREEEERRRKEEEEKQKARDEMVEEQIRKDLVARAQGKKAWDDDEEEGEEVDDTDDIDPEAEYAAWKLRELKRIRRDREAIEAKEKELAEIERRRNLTEEERRAEDEEHLAKQKEEKEGRGKMAYMQKYFHKGAFYQDESEAVGVAGRDLMGARIQDDIRNRELLPKALQLRDQTKIGRKGATKYRDLKSEDTGQWGRFDDRPRRDFDRFGGDERFQPDNPFAKRDDYGRGGGDGAKGANAIPLGDRKSSSRAPEGPRSDRYNDGDRGDRDRDRDRRRDYNSRDDRDSYHRRDEERDRRRSRSRSPRRDRDDRHSDRRKRSHSRDRDRDRDHYDSDKRRKVEAR